MIPVLSFRTWADVIALSLAIILSITLTFLALKRSGDALRGSAVFFLFLGPAVIGFNMAMHTLQVLYGAVEAITNGTFTYDFRFYSLLLIGSVLIYRSVSMLKQGWAKCMFRLQNMTAVYKNVIVVSIISASTIPFTPIGALPVLACIITLISLRFAHKTRNIAPTTFI